MAKNDVKTKATEVSVANFIAAVPDARRREEAAVIDAIHRRVTGLEPKMWGPSIIGYGSYDYVYDSGRSGTMCRAGFSPRKAAMTLYLMGHYCDRQAEAYALFARLGCDERALSGVGIAAMANGRLRPRVAIKPLPFRRGRSITLPSASHPICAAGGRC